MSKIIIIEIIGVMAFAISGALVAIRKNFDIFGIIVLGTITAVGGGAFRDVILGILPPTMFKNPFYVLIASITSILTFVFISVAGTFKKKSRNKILDLINFFDAVGLGIFAVTGTMVAILNGFFDNAFLCIFVGTITAIGGGMLRDILAMEVPFVLYKDIYASAAIFGSCVFYFLCVLNVNKAVSIIIVITSTILIRLFASFFNLRLPRITDFRFFKK